MSNKKKIVVVLIMISFTTLFCAIIFFAAVTSNPSLTNVKNNTTSTVTPTNVTITPVTYVTGYLDKIVNITKNDKSINSSDEQIRQTLLAKLNGKSGTVQQTASYTMTYWSVSDLFDTIITTPNLNQGKKEAEAWLLSQGLSQDGICKLPVIFIPSSEIQQQLKQEEQSVVFNPNPDGC